MESEVWRLNASLAEKLTSLTANELIWIWKKKKFSYAKCFFFVRNFPPSQQQRKLLVRKIAFFPRKTEISELDE